jgi:hypothetical protein
MKTKLEPIPAWITTALQGLTFWIGYKRALYRDYPLSEGALVTELRSLMHANLPDELFLKCEVGYSHLVKVTPRPAVIAGRTRADLVVVTKNESPRTAGKIVYSPQFLFEFKRAGAPAREIDKDLKRLAAFQECRPSARAFLVVLSETGRNDRFVTEKGKTRVGKHKVEGANAMYHIRRTVKAASAYTNRDSGNYATVVEVRANDR